jgi:predicted MPP superfamily phosphohydrolase
VNPEKLWFRGLPEGGALVEKLNLAFPRLPEGLEGKRILFASDVHAGFTFPEAAQERLVRQIEALAPDMVLWGGDFAETRRDAGIFMQKIARLKPPMGMAGVVGNNDRQAFLGALDELERLAERAGVKLLVNGRWALPVPGGELTVLGLDEDYHGSPDPSILDRRGQRGGDAGGGLAILLSHSPAPLDRLIGKFAPPDLILSGHTHGGQARLGRLSLYSLGYDRVRRGQRFFTIRGVKREAGAILVVSGGLGSSKIPLRIHCPPEMQLITLHKR